MKLNNKQQGFSLLEVMIALAVVSFLSFTVLQLVFTNLKASKSVELTASLENLLLEVNMALKDPAVCQTNLANFSSTTLPTPLDTGVINLSQITLPSVTKPLVSNNAALVNQPSTKVFLSIEGIKPVSTVSYLANITFNMDKGQGFLGARNIVRRIPINLTLTSAGGAITGCSTFGPSSGGAAATPPPAGGGGSSTSTTPADICALMGQMYDSVSGKCTGQSDVSLPNICESFGGTYDSSTKKCTGITTTTVASSGGVKPIVTPTPKPPCPAAETKCSTKTWSVPELTSSGQFNRDWTETIDGKPTRCQFHILCNGPVWEQNSCSCVVVK